LSDFLSVLLYHFFIKRWVGASGVFLSVTIINTIPVLWLFYFIHSLPYFFMPLEGKKGGDFIVYYQKLKIQPEAQAFMCDEFSN